MVKRPERPEWMRKKINLGELHEMYQLLSRHELNTVCENARCPNIGECFSKRTATFMILGNQCTRNCRFCAVQAGALVNPDPAEPENVAKATRELGLKHVVITCVTRDDLADGGAGHFAKTINAVRDLNPDTTIEILTSDFRGNWQDLKTVVAARPHIFGHNVETVPSLYQEVRPGADYQRSLALLRQVRQLNSDIITKSGLMLGLGEDKAEVEAVMQDVRDAGCGVITIGQYLSPGKNHLPVKEYVEPQVYEEYKATGRAMGFKYVIAGPYVRSSYMAETVKLDS
ncbi:MAG: lipoyl synthase [Firmicutes bacterium]|nr:lipoyl synthase [Bacillota bacterium]